MRIYRILFNATFMKKLLFLASACLFLAGGIKTATPQLLAQNTQTTTPEPTQQLELLTPGTQPRQELRIKPQVNTKQLMTMTMSMDVANILGGQAAPKIKTPATVMQMEVLVTQVDANGDIHSTFNYTEADVVADASVAPEILEAVRSSIKKMVGIKGTLITNNRGQVKSSNISLPEDIDPMTKTLLAQVSTSLDQMSSPVPQVAIGIGAKWRVSDNLKISSIKMNQSTIYELVSLKDNIAILKVTVDQKADAQDVILPGIPTDSANVSLKSMLSQGQGQLTLALDSVMPTRSIMSIRSQSEMSIKETTSGKETTIGTQMSMQINLESQSK